MAKGMSPREMALEIASSADTQDQLAGIAATIAADATGAAVSLVADRHNEHPFFGTDVVVTDDGARAHVWAANGPAIHAERKGAVLVKAAARHGQFRKDAPDKPTGKARRGRAK